MIKYVDKEVHSKVPYWIVQDIYFMTLLAQNETEAWIYLYQTQ